MKPRLQKYFRSSCKTRPDPIYYRNKINRLDNKRYELWAKIQIEEESGVESTILRLHEQRLADKSHWYMVQLAVAQRMRNN